MSFYVSQQELCCRRTTHKAIHWCAVRHRSPPQWPGKPSEHSQISLPPPTSILTTPPPLLPFSCQILQSHPGSLTLLLLVPPSHPPPPLNNLWADMGNLLVSVTLPVVPAGLCGLDTQAWLAACLPTLPVSRPQGFKCNIIARVQVYVMCVYDTPLLSHPSWYKALNQECVCMCVCVFCGRSSWQEALGPENICRRPQLNIPANKHT